MEIGLGVQLLQTAFVAGLFFRMGGIRATLDNLKDAVTELKTRVTHLEKNHHDKLA